MTLIHIVSVIALAVVGYVLFVVYPIFHAKYVDATLIPASHAYSHVDPARARTLLVLGDSTAVGVGASAEQSIAALLSNDLNASVENYAVSGAVTADLERQLAHAELPHYDLVEIQIGANDVLGMKSISHAARSLDAALSLIQKKSDHIVLLTAGDIGKSPIFKWPLNVIMSYRTRDLRERFIQICALHKAAYVDIFTKPDLIAQDPEKYHAPDGLHLNADGYAYWYALIRDTMREREDLKGFISNP